MKSFRTIFFWIIVFILLIIAIYFGNRYYVYLNSKDPYKTFLAPKIELAEFEIISLNSKQTKVLAKMLIKNQLPIGFTADSIEYNFYIDKIEVFKSSYHNSISIKGNDSSIISLPLTIFTDKLITVLKKSEQQGIDSVDYEMKATFYTNYTLNKKIKIEVTRRLPLFHMLDVNVVRIEIDSLRFSGTNLLLHTKVKNKNGFAIKLQDIDYRFLIAGNEWLEGKKRGPVNLQPHSVTDVTMTTSISFKELRKTLFELIKMGKNIDYKMEVRFKTYPDNAIMKNSEIFITSSGNLKEIIKFVQAQKKNRKK